MITFKAITDLDQLSLTDPAHDVIQERLDRLLETFHPYDPDTHGYVVLIEQGDTRINLPELKGPMADIEWDGVWKQDGHYHAVYCTNNEHAIEILIPEAEWLDADLRASLENANFGKRTSLLENCLETGFRLRQAGVISRSSRSRSTTFQRGHFVDGGYRQNQKSPCPLGEEQEQRPIHLLCVRKESSSRQA